MYYFVVVIFLLFANIFLSLHGCLAGHKAGVVSSCSLYPQTKVGDILDSGPSRRRRHRNFLVDAITQKQINFFFQTWYTC